MRIRNGDTVAEKVIMQNVFMIRKLCFLWWYPTLGDILFEIHKPTLYAVLSYYTLRVKINSDQGAE